MILFILDWLHHLPIRTHLGLPQFEHVVINYHRLSGHPIQGNPYLF